MKPTQAQLVRVWDEFFYVLRREGLPISTEQAQTALRALSLVGFADRSAVETTLAATLAQSASDQRLLARLFHEHFSPGLRGKNLWERLEAAGFDASERSAVADWLRAHDQEGGADALVAWLEPGSARDDFLARAAALSALRGEADLSRVGFLIHRVLSEAHLPQAKAQLSALELHLRDALGAARAAELAALLRDELAREARALQRALRDGVEQRLQAPQPLERTAWAALDADELREAERAVARLAQRLLARARVRQSARAAARSICAPPSSAPRPPSACRWSCAVGARARRLRG